MQSKIVPTQARHFNREQAILPANACTEISLADHVLERIYHPINAIANLIALILERANARASLIELGFQLAHPRGDVGCGTVSRFRHASLAFTAPRPSHVFLSAARIPAASLASHNALARKNFGGSLNRRQLDNPT
jgi:hypothetical protein